MKAENPRQVKLKIGGDGDRGWKDYAAIPPFTVSTEMTNYEFEFTMKMIPMLRHGLSLIWVWTIMMSGLTMLN